MFVQGANSLIFAIGRTEEEKKLIVNLLDVNGNSLLQLWLHSAVLFASFPLFYKKQVLAGSIGYGC